MPCGYFCLFLLIIHFIVKVSLLYQNINLKRRPIFRMSPNAAESVVKSDSPNAEVKFDHPNCQLCTSKNLPYLFSKIRHVDTAPKEFEFYSLRLMKLIAEDALALMADKG